MSLYTEIPLENEVNDTGLFNTNIKKYKITRGENIWLGLNPNNGTFYGRSRQGRFTVEDQMTTSEAVGDSVVAAYIDYKKSELNLSYVTEIYNSLPESEKNTSGNLNVLNNALSLFNYNKSQLDLSKTRNPVPGIIVTQEEI